MKYFNKLGIRQKFQIILGITFLLIALFLFFYFPQKQKSEMTESLQEKSKVIAQMIAKTSEAGLIFDDVSSVQTHLEVFKEMSDVNFAVVLKKDGTKFSAFNESEYENYKKNISNLIKESTESYAEGNKVFGLHSVGTGKEISGYVVVALSTSHVDDLASSAQNTALIISLIIFILGLSASRIFFNKVIYKPVKNLTSIADKLSVGDIEVTIKSNSNDEIGQLEKSFLSIIDSVKNQTQIAQYIANGKLDVKANVKSSKDSLSISMNNVIDSLVNLIDEANLLTKSAKEGRLSERGNVSKYNGGYQEIVQGINDTLDALLKPITEGVQILEKVALGDFIVKISSAYKGDHQLIKNSINSLTDSLNRTLLEVNESISATASASNQIASSAEEMTAGVQEQSSQIDEVASAIEEMASTIIQTTRNASSALEYSQKSGSLAKNGGEVVKQTVEGMNEIADIVSQTSTTIKELGKSSNQIGEIIQVIDDIADQTNLLALNAAIEAARAGEQGRGFAVVADEVRKLAERTTTATKEIATMIKQIQKDTNNAVESIESGTKVVENGKELANKAIISLKEIIESTNETKDVINLVAAASEQQSSSAEQISRNLTNINLVAKESAVGVQQIAKATEDLSNLTINLQEKISMFKLEANVNNFSIGTKTNIQRNVYAN
ncbi:MAG: HAMP domain-containing protein [Ignavibacteriae bacterium]|nr:HAMP domain-containing protein [Ignavibacteriota bacterium]